MKVALVGNPNCGKTTVFNALTGARQKVGNWAGVTVDKKTGRFNYDKQTVEVIDLPGLYSMVSSEEGSLDEKIASEFILKTQPNLIVNILDASNLERNLFLTLQLIEMKVPIILAVNMVDIAQQKGIKIDFSALEKSLGLSVVPMISRRGVGVEDLKKTIVKGTQAAEFKHLDYYPQPLIDQISAVLLSNTPVPDKIWLSLRLLENDHYALSLLDECTQHSVENRFTDQAMTIANARYQAIHDIGRQCLIRETIAKHRATEIIDSVCMNKYLGLPIFLFIMYLMFEFSITIGGALQPLFDNSSRAIFIDGLSHVGMSIGLPTWMTAVVAQGIGLGINTVVTFVPQIGCMFLFLCLLEDSGYMARAAFVMDRIMQAVGLPGKSFVPLIIGFGCNVPAVMATRALERRRDRLLTIMMAPFVSCGARLAIFAVFASAFFAHGGGATVVFLLYVIGIVCAIITGLVVKNTLLKGENTPFIMEIPVYHLPNTRAILLQTWQRLKRFLVRAGKVIIPVCVVIGALNAVQPNGHLVTKNTRDSILATIGRTITPILAPIGIKQDNWPATVGLITGTLAKEVVVGTLNTLYSQQKTNTNPMSKNYNFWADLKSAIDETVSNFKAMSLSSFSNPFTANEADAHMDKTAMGTMVISFGSIASAFAYLLFVLLYIPCVATIGAVTREAGRAWAWMSVAWSTAIAYCVALFAYQITRMATAPWIAGSQIVAALGFIALLVYLMHYFADRVHFRPSLAKTCADCKGC